MAGDDKTAQRVAGGTYLANTLLSSGTRQLNKLHTYNYYSLSSYINKTKVHMLI